MALERPIAETSAPAPYATVASGSRSPGRTTAVHGAFVAGFTIDSPELSTNAMDNVPAADDVNATTKAPRSAASGSVRGWYVTALGDTVVSAPSSSVTMSVSVPSSISPEAYLLFPRASMNVTVNSPETPATYGPGRYVDAPPTRVASKSRAPATTTTLDAVNPTVWPARGVRLHPPVSFTPNRDAYVPSPRSVTSSVALVPATPTRSSSISRGTPPSTRRFACASRATYVTAYVSPATAFGTPSDSTVDSSGEKTPGRTTPSSRARAPRRA